MKHFVKAFSLALALIMAVTTLPLQAFAATDGKKYVSEIVTVAAATPADAKSKLASAGYKMVVGNLNLTLDTGVYLGYKETENRKEAITDIAAMNMLGKFSYSDYQQIMKDYEENIEAVVEDIGSFIEEFQNGYNNETKNALLAYQALNLFKDDDSEKLMGDYFLDFDSSPEAIRALTDTLMQANDDIVMSMIRALSFAGDPDDTTLVDRLSNVGPNVLDQYEKSFPTHAAFEEDLASRYGTVADTLYKDWDFFYNYLLNVEKDVVAEDKNGQLEVKDDAFDPTESDGSDTDGLSDEQKELVAQADELAEIPEALDNTTDFGFYTLLASSKYGTGTLLSFFKQPSSQIDKTDLYPLVYCMSDGQKKQVDFIGIKEILQSAFSAEEDAEEGTSDAIAEYEEFTEALEPVSIFDGVDRTVFDDGVAFTSSAVNHESLSDDSWLEKLGGIVGGDLSYWSKRTIICWASTCGLAATGVTATVLKKNALKKLPKVTEKLNAAVQKYEEEYEKYLNRWDGGSPAFAREVNEAGLDEMFPQYRYRLNRATENYNSVQRTVKFSSVIKVASFVLLVVALAYDIYTLVDYFTQEKPVEENIPHHIMSTAMTPYGEDYVYYQTVKTLDGDAADVNNHEADAKTGWLVLYTTKDTDAGSPICAGDLLIKTGSKNFGENASFAHLFNETAAINLLDPLYTGKEDKYGGTYILFERETSASYAGSAISGGVAAIIAAVALIIGAAGGSIITTTHLRKKKKKDPVGA